ncbi:DUF192 domain-containing protein [Thermococcus sp.]|uniref:DUF192 domain-containing protein n=1 Tax=Thermococcus sp. TaxID=35749 RepID=UPI00262F8657|nr:DUF192 domain-containing protein [Thermococcus sp.]
MIINETKNRVWHGAVRLADNFFRRFRGLMLVSNVNYSLVFVLPVESRLNASIHMFFMLSDIDVIWLDSTKRVVDFRRAKRWRVYSPKKPAKYIIEGPAGLIKALQIEEGDLISWEITEDKKKSIPVGVPLSGKVSFEKTNSIVMAENITEALAEDV